ncbi:hypothetical protein SSPS47_09520 [Streptomyces sp. S4.7]|uniref:hypothetical protein n=1 Tax=Streptomyces sp. S4.7 TaxID=2705439 RepID=UPI0013991FDB|nr:hypothetical protein [Streptomyces sp. S4.7]QHY95362.1 hypothetical protein SSPS47_09520 [Streptomyces sp. S4.7]
MTDRIRAAATQAAPTTEDGLRRILALPSIASQVLTAAADHLAEHKPDQELTVAGWARALALADARVLTSYPSYVAQHAGRRALRALTPDMWASSRTRGEWALCLRAAAGTV